MHISSYTYVYKYSVGFLFFSNAYDSQSPSAKDSLENFSRQRLEYNTHTGCSTSENRDQDEPSLLLLLKG